MRLVALDMDGTLLNRKGEISDENVQIIMKAQQMGIKVAIATGRAYKDARIKLDPKDLVCPIIGVNGAVIHLEDGRQISSVSLPKETAAEILRLAKEQGVYCEVYTNQATYATDNAKESLFKEVDKIKSTNPEMKGFSFWRTAEQQFQQARVTFIDGFSGILADKEHDIYKVLVFTFDLQKLDRIRTEVIRNPQLAVSSSAEHNIEITHVNAQKGEGLRRLAEYYQIPIEQTMAVGDNYNDVSMFRVAGISVAMGNAGREIQDMCDAVTKTNDEHGVAAAIEQYAVSQVDPLPKG